jgi:hypothetical protein
MFLPVLAWAGFTPRVPLCPVEPGPVRVFNWGTTVIAKLASLSPSPLPRFSPSSYPLPPAPDL